MSAEPIRVSTAEDWSAWEGQVVNGLFPLRRFLGGSEHSGVFLTEYKARNLPEAAIKFVPADRQRAVTQLSQWRAAANFSHPHLLRLFDMGGFQFGGRAFLFVVMEYADQTLAQVLPKRALVPDEVREMLPPTLEALSFLHRYDLVHGHVKPSNVLVVGDQVKLSSDTIRPIGSAANGSAGESSHEPPEASGSAMSTAGDVWGLGVTLVETLTQHLPTWGDAVGDSESSTANLPAPFADIVRRCLSRVPGDRPSAREIELLFNPAPPAPEPPAAQAHEPSASAVAPATAPAPHAAHVAADTAGQHASTQPTPGAAPRLETPTPQRGEISVTTAPDTSVHQAPPPAVLPSAGEPPPPQTSRSGALMLPVIGGALLIFLVGWFLLRSPQKPSPPPTSPTTATSTVPTPAARPESATAVESDTVAPSTTASTPAAPTAVVLHEVTPDIPRRILSDIRGNIKVTVRVLVDPTGNVVGDLLERAGPSKYFARRAREAATNWKFAPADTQSSRVWLIHFDFSRSGVTGRAAAVK
jgi:serine/threonine protein kinase